MPTSIRIATIVACLACSAPHANSGCDTTSSAQYRDTLRLVDSLRPDKPGLLRVYASDDSEFNGGQALWMRGQMRHVERTCADGAQTEATRLLNAVQELLSAHHRDS